MMDLDKVLNIFILLFFQVLLVSISFYFGHSLHNDYVSTVNTDLLKDMNYSIVDRVSEDDIVVLADKVIIYGDYEYSKYADTNSMLPLLDYGSTGLSVRVTNQTQIYIGDIISFNYTNRSDVTQSLVHRVIEIGYDDEGKYYITKGDSLTDQDPFKVRENQITRLLVGVIW